MARITILDPTASAPDIDADPGPSPRTLSGCTVGIRSDRTWRSFEWVADEWEKALAHEGAEVHRWTSGNRIGDEGERTRAQLAAFVEANDLVITWLTSARLDVADDDVDAFTKLATGAGWGDGLPVVPPTEGRVREWCAASGRFPEELLAELPPRNGRCTVEKLAVNAVLAGAPAASMPLLCAAVEAMAEPDFNLFALNTTTSCVVPGVFVNGPVRDELGIPYG